jgi:hypothetical protein
VVGKLFIRQLVGFDQIGVAEDRLHPLVGQAKPLAAKIICEPA